MEREKKKNIKFPYPPMAARAPIAKALTRIYRQQNTSPKDQSQNSTLLCTHLIIILVLLWPKGGGAVASWLARSSPDRAIRAPSPGRGHCVVFLGKTLNSPPRSINRYRQIVGENLTNCGRMTCDELSASRPGGLEILLSASCYRNRG